MSSVGIGTYLGEPDEDTDQAYATTVSRALELGVNVIDTAINYRLQRSERSIGGALAALTAQSQIRRQEVVVCTKAGFLTPDGALPGDPGRYFQENYLQPGICTIEDIAAGVHCMAPQYLADQLERSLRNLGLECIDVFYLHNPETQLSAVPREEFLRRLRLAFELLESKAGEGKIQWYGTATWSGYRQPPGSRDYLSVEEAVQTAREVAGEQHHFRFLQLPFNLAMPEAFVAHNQTLGGRALSLLDTARELGITVVASASLMQASLIDGLPAIVGQVLDGLQSDAQRALQFVRSAPGIGVALVGMKNSAHVEENLRVAAVPPVPPAQFLKLFEVKN